jgi:endonuclease III
MSTDWEVLPTQMSTDWEVLPTVKLDSSNSKLVNSLERTTPKQTQLIETLLSEKTSDATSASRHLRKRYGVSRLDALTSSTADEIIKGLIGGTMATWLAEQIHAEKRSEANAKATARLLADQSEPRPSPEQAKLNCQKLREIAQGRAPSEF